MARSKTVRSTISDKEIRQLVIERLRTLPSGKLIAIGSSGKSYSPEELMKEVQEKTDLGNKIIEVELEFLRLMKEEDFYEKYVAPHH